MAELLLEIGCEELPAGFIDPALAYLESELPKLLEAARIEHQDIGVDGTPRRLAVWLQVADRQSDLEEEITGPAWSVAFGPDGTPTQAGVGFLKKNGLDASSVYQKESKKGPVVGGKKREVGKPSAEVLPALLEALLPKIPFKKTMRWGDRHVTNGQVFGRPVQWLLSILDGKPLPIRFADVVSGVTTRGHRYHAPAEVKVTSLSGYLAALEKGQVQLSRKARAARVVDEAHRLAASVGGRLVEDAALVDIVKNLVEKPWPILGRFDERFLAVPKELLISEAREHQKYFMVVDQKGDLLPCFVVVTGADARDKAALAAGNARVLRARFEDGAFYFRTDRERTLISRIADLDKLVFHKELGHYGEKAVRLVEVAAQLVAQVASDLVERGVDVARTGEEAGRAAVLCKTDLTTGVVNEFPELQGIMGRTYALADGEPKNVAEAIEDHYAPRLAGQALPRNHAGAIAGIADRVDTIVGILGIGKAPTGSADPFALRRAAVGVLSIAIDRGYRFALADLVATSIRAYQRQNRLMRVDVPKLNADVTGFIGGRLRSVLVDRAASNGFADVADVVDASLAAKGGADDLPDVWARVQALSSLRGQDPTSFSAVAATFKRVGNIVRKARDDGNAIGLAVPGADELEHEGERELRDLVAKLGDEGSHDDILRQVVALKPAVDRFFDDVMVMVDDVKLRSARLALLGAIEGRLSGVADFTRLQGG